MQVTKKPNERKKPCKCEYENIRKPTQAEFYNALSYFLSYEQLIPMVHTCSDLGFKHEGFGIYSYVQARGKGIKITRTRVPFLVTEFIQNFMLANIFFSTTEFVFYEIQTNQFLSPKAKQTDLTTNNFITLALTLPLAYAHSWNIYTALRRCYVLFFFSHIYDGYINNKRYYYVLNHVSAKATAEIIKKSNPAVRKHRAKLAKDGQVWTEEQQKIEDQILARDKLQKKNMKYNLESLFKNVIDEYKEVFKILRFWNKE